MAFRTALVLLCTIAVASAGRPLVREVRTNREFNALLKHHKKTGLPVIVDFYSHGCGPCRMIAPHYKRLAKQYKNRVVFAKVDVNVNRETSGAQRIRSMPTLQFYLNGKKKHQFSGGDVRGIETWARKLDNEAQRLNVRITLENLKAYYEKHDPENPRDDEKLKAMIEKAGGEDGGPGHHKLYKALRKKYGKGPKTVKRVVKESPKKSRKKREEKGKKGKGEPEKANLNLATLEELKAELERREDEAAFDPNDGEEASAEEEPAGSIFVPNSEYAERVVVIGGGPAGLSAAIYAARAGLKPVVVAPPMGGQLQGKGVNVENYPAVMGDTGPGIVAAMATQAEKAGALFALELVEDIDLTQRPFTIKTNTSSFTTHSIIVATGADSRWLGVEGEEDFRGGGVSSCATCDGFLYRDMDVVVVGGGDTAMEDALVLARTSKSVTVIHRRDQFRASKVLADRVLQHEKIKVRWNATVHRFKGGEPAAAEPAAAEADGGEAKEDRAKEGAKEGAKEEEEEEGLPDAEAEQIPLLTHVVIKDRNSGELEELPVAAAFVAIGHDPNTKLFQGLEMDDNSYLITEGKSTRCSIEGVFAAGDVADHVYRQAVTSAGTGAMAALDAERWLSENGIKDEQQAALDEMMAEILAEFGVKEEL